MKGLLNVLPMKPKFKRGYVYVCAFHGHVVLNPQKVKECKRRHCDWLTKIPRLCFYEKLSKVTDLPLKNKL